jgi:hypothetical protein
MIKKRNALALLLGAFAMIVCSFVSCKMNSDDDDDGGGGVYTPTIGSYSAPSFSGNYYPATGSTSAYTDTMLIVKFDSTPTIVSSDNAGTLAAYIYSSDGTLVDTIKPYDETYYTGNDAKGTVAALNVKDQLIQVFGNYVTIKPHTSTTGYSLLSNSTAYYVKIDSGLITGKISNVDFTGISDSTSWTFTTSAAPAITSNTINVSTTDSTADFYSIQGAFNYLRSNSSTGDWTINVAAGSYLERLWYYGSANVTMIGPAGNSYGNTATVSWTNLDLWNTGTTPRPAFLWVGGNLTLKNMSFKNTCDRSVVGTNSTQAETLYFDSAAYLVAHNCSFISHQDTLLLGATGSRCWLYDCYIEGDTDYIWGYADVALLENCTLHCVRDEAISNQVSYIFAPRSIATQAANKGFVLMNSKITVDSGVTAYYGRNSGADTTCAVFNNAFSGSGTIASALWGGVGSAYKDAAEDGAICFKDYNNTMNGSTIDTSSRLTGCYPLTERVCKREYNGRTVILNRGYSITDDKYETSSTLWDISSYETEFSAPAETSGKNVFVDPVYVNNFVAGSGTITFATQKMNSSATVTLSATETLADKTNYPNTIIASFDASTGILTTTAGSYGTVTVTATSSDGTTDTATVNVIPKAIPVTSVTFGTVNTAPNLYSLTTLDAALGTASGENPTYTSVKWTTSDASVIKFFDSTNNAWVESIETETPEVKYYALTSSNATITATALNSETQAYDSDSVSATTDAITVSSVAEWNPTVAGVQVNTDIQSKVAGKFNTAVIDAITNNGKNSKTAKMGLKKGNTRLQTRNIVIDIPVTQDCDITVQLDSTSTAPTVVTAADATLNYQGLVADGTKITWNADTFTYTIHFDYATQKVAGSAIGVTLAQLTKGDSSITALSDYYAQLVFGSNDIYISKITKTNVADDTYAYSATKYDVALAFADSSNAALDLNGTTTVTRAATASGTDASSATISYTSSNTGVATVSSAGLVTAVGMGYTTITASTPADSDSSTFATATYTVIVSNSASAGASYKLTLGNIVTPQTNATYDFGQIKGIGCYWNDAVHGWCLYANSTLSFAVSGACTVTVGGCDYGTAQTLSLSDGTTTVTGAYSTSCSGSVDLAWTGTSAATLTLTFAAKAYVPYISVASATAATVYATAQTYDFVASYATYTGYTLASNGFAMSGGNNGNAAYGWDMKAGSTLAINVSGNCTVTFTGSTYSSLYMGCTATGSGTISPSAAQTTKVSTDKTGTYAFTYTGSADTLTFTAQQNAGAGTDSYTPSVTIAYN